MRIAIANHEEIFDRIPAATDNPDHHTRRIARVSRQQDKGSRKQLTVPATALSYPANNRIASAIRAIRL